MTDSLDAGPAASNPGSGSDRPARTGGLGGGPRLALVATGASFVVLGGLIAAVTEPLDLEHGSWLAAYLVLVCGVAQYAMGRLQEPKGPEAAHSSDRAWTQFGAWNLGNAAVIAGTLAIGTLMVVAGSLLLIVALLIALRATWSPAGGLTRAASPLVIRTYRVLLLVLLVSIPVGILLSHLRS